MSNLFVLRDVNKSYVRGRERTSIFESLDLSIRRGQFVAIMGPSGSGKTTLLNLLGGVDRVTSGEVEFDGRRIDKLSESDLAGWRSDNVGFIFQFYNLMPMLSAAENVELPLMLTRLSRSECRQRVETAMELVGLSDRAGNKPSQLSGGQQQRVAIARAIVSDPALILADEPTGDLDRKTADEVLNILQTLNRDFGKTIIMVTHDPQAARYASTTLHLDKGEFVTEPEMA